jgi:hypothetical protein
VWGAMVSFASVVAKPGSGPALEVLEVCPASTEVQPLKLPSKFDLRGCARLSQVTPDARRRRPNTGQCPPPATSISPCFALTPNNAALPPACS